MITVQKSPDVRNQAIDFGFSEFFANLLKGNQAMRAITIILSLLLLLTPLVAEAKRTGGFGIVKKTSKARKSYIQGEYRALLIGNDVYQAKKWPNLKTAVKDVTALADLLITRYQFKKKNVILRTNLTRSQMLKAFQELKAVAKPKDNVLIYYAGHGEFDQDERGWWVPVDGEDNTGYISNDEILGRLRSIKAKHKLLISDSCFSGNLLSRGITTAPKKGRLPSRYVVEKTKLTSAQGLSSGGNEPVSDGGKKWGGNSIFAYHLLGQLRANQKPYLSVRSLGYKLAEQVANDTATLFGKGQTPVFSSLKNQGDQGGEFFFAPDPKSILSTGGKVALVFMAPPDDDEKKLLEKARDVIATRLAESLDGLYIPMTDQLLTVDAESLEKNLPALIRKNGAEAALVMDISGSLKKQPTLMWQGHATLKVALKNYRIENGKLIKTGSYALTTQRLPIRKWKTGGQFAAEQLKKTAAKVLKKTSTPKLNQYLESVRE